MRTVWIAAAWALAVAPACHAAAPRADRGAPATVVAAEATIARDELRAALASTGATAGVVVILDRDTGAPRALIGATAGPGGVVDDDTLPATRAWVTGSTLKPLTVAIALDAGAVTPATVVDCATRTYAAGALVDAAPHGPLSVADVLAVSSNVGASRVLDAMGLPALIAGLHRLHLDDPPARWPAVTDAASLDAALLAGGELAAATPLQVAAAYGAVFRGGAYRAPTGGAAAPALSAAAAATTVALLAHTITSPIGTGGAAAVAGHQVAGKTGTAEVGDHRYVSFVGTVVDGAPRVILVGLEVPAGDGSTGGAIAAPLFARIATRLR